MDKFPCLSAALKYNHIIAEKREKNKRFGQVLKKGECGKRVEKGVDNLCEDGEKMWTGGEKKGEERGRKRRGKKRGNKKTNSTKILWNVEKNGGGNQQRVEKRSKVWYNRSMDGKMPDFGRLIEKIRENEEAFGRFYTLLCEGNRAFNLTSVIEKEEVIHKHFLDSLAGEGFLAQGADVCEVGSGAGFPSLPIAIVRGDLSFTLVESIKKKCVFLQDTAQKLGLNVRVCNLRAEEAGRGELREAFSAVIARAVAPLPALLEYCLPLVRVGGIFLAWKGQEDETPVSRRAARVLGGGEPEKVCYELPGGYGRRMLVLCKKVRPTPAKYPRGHGRERKDPIL